MVPKVGSHAVPPIVEVLEIAPGIFWTRLPLPFRLDHVNAYIIEDGSGWAIVDTGIADQTTRGIWEKLVSGPLAGRPLTRVIVTHHHADHIGLAGWMCKKFEIELHTSQSTYLTSRNISLSPGTFNAQPYRDFHERNGMDPETTVLVGSAGHRYVQMVASMPSTFTRLISGDTIDIGGREFRALCGDGHAPEQTMLHCPSAGVFLAADQVIDKISPNIIVSASDSNEDPLGHYLKSLEAIKTEIPNGALVLPGNNLPFYKLHERCEYLVNHNIYKCELIRAACSEQPYSIADLVPVLFPKKLDGYELGVAFGEVHAHVNFLLGVGQLKRRKDKLGNVKFTSAEERSHAS